MNQLLSSLEVFYHKLQAYHWYVKGLNFFTLHTQLESYYDQIAQQIDTVAETMLMVGQEPVSTLSEFLELSTIQEAEHGYVSGKDVLVALKADFTELYNQAEAIQAEGDVLVSPTMDELIASYSKSIWMISQALIEE